jgi:hypothetical protein
VALRPRLAAGLPLSRAHAIMSATISHNMCSAATLEPMCLDVLPIHPSADLFNSEQEFGGLQPLRASRAPAHRDRSRSPCCPFSGVGLFWLATRRRERRAG